LDLAKKEDFRVNLIEAYDRPWKRQLEGAVGGYWGLFDAVKRVVKYPPGIDISNFPRWKLKMCGGMGLSILTFLVAWLTLRGGRQNRGSAPATRAAAPTYPWKNVVFLQSRKRF
jgi:hypothetical protein